MNLARVSRLASGTMAKPNYPMATFAALVFGLMAAYALDERRMWTTDTDLAVLFTLVAAALGGMLGARE